ncbi:hypothetical protein COB21_05095 [Candidatus Aerophobetes bacterium]|uniref:Uncharacterized protein n=1 Tax=Aerophobetes bacterium TaxID=2030807 RepID=A0A2A4X071_UNCAE|nr:MAG: hypothetical protein COB21_05095 [Candidatus Aerophobetes bacterium]
MLSALCLPLMADDLKAGMAEVPSIESVEENKKFNFYLSNNFALALTPGVRWQNGHWGADLAATFSTSGFNNMGLNGLYYFNPYNNKSGLQHYVSLGLVSTLRGALEVVDEGDNYAKVEKTPGVMPSFGYGFQSKAVDNSYWFMHFALVGPVEISKVSTYQEGNRLFTSIEDSTLIKTVISLGYAF